MARRLSPLEIGAAKILARYSTREPSLAFHFPMDSLPPAPPKRRVARNKVPAREAEQLYSFAQVSRLVGVPGYRLSALAMVGKFPAAAVIVPGGGHKGRRWTASQLNELLRTWANPLAEPQDHRPTPRH